MKSFLGLISLLMVAQGALASGNDVETLNSWQGPYLGLLNSNSQFKTSYLSDHTYGNFSLPVTNTTTGDDTMIGVIAGYNFSVHQFVLGVEGDYNPSKHNTSICRGSTDTPSICNDAWLGYSKIASEIKYKGSLRVRGGYQLHKYLAYITAGAAFVQTKNNLDVFCPDGCSTSDAAPFLSNTTTIKSETRPIYGIGAEYKLTNKLNVGLEHLILKTSRVSQSVNHAATYGPQLISSSISGKIAISRLRLAYNF